jgi:NAD(P)H-hydrate epimerase
MFEPAGLVWSPAQVRAADRRAIELGLAAWTLMTRAAEAAFVSARRRWPEARDWHVLCGLGNNAGDGYVFARLARRAGHAARVYALGPPGQLTGDAARAEREWHAAGGQTLPWRDPPLPAGGIIVDALVGTGLSRPVAGDFAAAIAWSRSAGLPVLAMDVPSGLDADSGQVRGSAMRASVTITFVGHKAGLFTGDGPEHAGDVELADLDVPAEVFAGEVPRFRLANAALLSRSLPPRPATSHKGHFGHVLVVGGDEGMPGAVALCGSAALRAGAGLVTVATRAAHAAPICTVRPELMCRGIEDPDALSPLLDRATVVAVGPGLGQSTWGRGMLATVLSASVPLIVDADALNLLAAAPRRRPDWVLTPHPGEAGRLLGATAAVVQADRSASLRRLVATFGGTVLLKGRGTLVAGDIEAGAAPWLIAAGNPGMATAGMGDVLTGVIAGLVAQMRSTAPDVVAAGAFAHATAGDQAAGAAPRGLIASDLLPALRGVLNP